MTLRQIRAAMIVINRARADRTADSDLWFHVLFRGVLDAFGLANPDRRANVEDVRVAGQQWMQSEDFRTVCELADLEPEYVVDCLRQAQAVKS